VIRKGAIDEDKWSAFEFTLVPLEEGAQVIAPFGVVARGERIYTLEMPLTVAPSSAVAAPPVFRWETPLAQLQVGRWATFRLVASDTRPLSRDILSKLRFAPPPQAIVESAAIAPSTVMNTAVIEIRVLPMRPGAFRLAAVEFDCADAHGNPMRLRIPELKSTIKAN
jgi:hypothetical protein